MFLHIGADVVIRLKHVVAIIDFHTRQVSGVTKEFLQLAEVEGRLVDVSDGGAKSFVLAEDKVYVSPISSVTLKKRADHAAELGLDGRF